MKPKKIQFTESEVFFLLGMMSIATSDILNPNNKDKVNKANFLRKASDLSERLLKSVFYHKAYQKMNDVLLKECYKALKSKYNNPKHP